MKKLFAHSMICFMCLFIQKAVAQNSKCDFEIDKTDDFTKERIMQTKTFQIISETLKQDAASKHWNVQLKFKSINGKIMLGIDANTKYTSSAVLNPMASAMSGGNPENINVCYLQFSDSSVLKLEKNISATQVKSKGLKTISTNFYDLSEENIDKITREKILKMRLQPGKISVGMDADFKIKEKDAAKIIADAICIKNP